MHICIHLFVVTDHSNTTRKISQRHIFRTSKALGPVKQQEINVFMSNGAYDLFIYIIIYVRQISQVRIHHQHSRFL